jgi:hypothetical protein
MRAVTEIRAEARYARAIAATADLLSRLRLEFAFVGEVARGAWLDREVDTGAIDLLAVMSPEQKNNVAMMASNRGFRVDRDEIEQTEELDLIPLGFTDAEGEVRVHILVASNALYGRMVAGASRAEFQGATVGIVTAEDLTLLLLLADDERSTLDRLALTALDSFDRTAFNERLVSIGLGEQVIEG